MTKGRAKGDSFGEEAKKRVSLGRKKGERCAQIYSELQLK